MEDLTVSIVTYNNEKVLPMILKSLSNTRNVSFSVTVVDNASKDESCNIVSTMLPHADIIRLDKNVGYGRANNVAIAKTAAKYHLVVNPDVSFPPDLLERCISFMEEHKDVVLLSPRVFFPDGHEQFLPKCKPTPAYLAGGVIEQITGRDNALRNAYTLRDKDIDSVKDIDFATGCFMLMRTDPLKRLNGFDERFFLYFEDADLTLRMQKFGRTVYVPSLIITHAWNRENMKKRGIKHELASLLKFWVKWRSGREDSLNDRKQ